MQNAQGSDRTEQSVHAFENMSLCMQVHLCMVACLFGSGCTLWSFPMFSTVAGTVNNASVSQQYSQHQQLKQSLD